MTRFAYFADGGGMFRNRGKTRIRVMGNDGQEVARTGWHDTHEEAKIEAREIVREARKAAELVDAAGVN